MYHGLRKALTSGVSKAVAKDTRVSAVEEAYVRLEKGIGSLVWMLDNCEATWSAQAAFTKYLPIIASDIYSRSDPVAKDVISATSKLAGELAIASSNTAVFAPIRSELAALKERVAKLCTAKAEWLRCISDKAYYDEKYTKISQEKADPEKEKRTLIKKAQTNDNLNKLSAALAAEFDECNYEKLVLTDKVLLAVMSSQCNNARKADFVLVHEILDRHHNRDIPVPQRDDQLSSALTGVKKERRRSSSSETSAKSGHSSITGSTNNTTSSNSNNNMKREYAPPPGVPNYAPPPKTKSKDYGTPPYSNQPYATPPLNSYTSSYPPPASSNYNNSSSSSSFGNLHPNRPAPPPVTTADGPKHARRKSNPQSLGSWNSSTAPDNRAMPHSSTAPDDLALRLNDLNIDINPPRNTGYSPTAPSAPPVPPLPPPTFSGLGGRPTVDMEFSTHPPY